MPPARLPVTSVSGYTRFRNFWVPVSRTFVLSAREVDLLVGVRGGVPVVPVLLSFPGTFVVCRWVRWLLWFAVRSVMFLGHLCCVPSRFSCLTSAWHLRGVPLGASFLVLLAPSWCAVGVCLISSRGAFPGHLSGVPVGFVGRPWLGFVPLRGPVSSRAEPGRWNGGLDTCVFARVFAAPYWLWACAEGGARQAGGLRGVLL